MSQPTKLSLGGKKGVRMVQILRRDIIPKEYRREWMFYGTSTKKKTTISRRGLYQKDASYNLDDQRIEANELSQKIGGKPIIFAFLPSEHPHIKPESLYEMDGKKIDEFFKTCRECPIYNQEYDEPCELYCVAMQVRNESERNMKDKYEYDQSFLLKEDSV